jgi:hypothetical protein
MVYHGTRRKTGKVNSDQLFKSFGKHPSPQYSQKAGSTVPCGFGGCAAALLAADGVYITGQELNLNGGYQM